MKGQSPGLVAVGVIFKAHLIPLLTIFRYLGSGQNNIPVRRPIALTIVLFLTTTFAADAQKKVSGFRMLVMAEQDQNHGAFVDTARVWLDAFAKSNGITIDYVHDAKRIDDAFLNQYQAIFQLNYPPYMWSDTAMRAFEGYITEGRGGWVGLHHATLLGEFDGYPMWSWFSGFMGDIRFKNYIAVFAAGQVNVEDKKHPVMKNVPAKFLVTKDEWYTYDKSPRPNVHVIASVDESTYTPDTKIKMGDHPVIWTNEHMKARNVYIFMGHHPNLFKNEAYITLLKNAILWAGGK